MPVQAFQLDIVRGTHLREPSHSHVDAALVEAFSLGLSDLGEGVNRVYEADIVGVVSGGERSHDIGDVQQSADGMQKLSKAAEPVPRRERKASLSVFQEGP